MPAFDTTELSPQDWAALETFELATIDGVRDLRLPETAGTVHALHLAAPAAGPDFFVHSYMRSECRVRLRVRLPILFDPRDPDACPNCVAVVSSVTQRPSHSSSPVCAARALDAEVRQVRCVQYAGHSTVHRSDSGEVWIDGDRYTSPLPSGFVGPAPS
jgi:hypothetical protein